MRGPRPEVWEQARMYWPDQPAIQDAWVEAVTDIEGAFLAMNRLPHGPDHSPLGAAQTKLNEVRELLLAWARQASPPGYQTWGSTDPPA